MKNLSNQFGFLIEKMIDEKIEESTLVLNDKIRKLEEDIYKITKNPPKEILQQKEVFEMLGIGRRKLKN